MTWHTGIVYMTPAGTIYSSTFYYFPQLKVCTVCAMLFTLFSAGDSFVVSSAFTPKVNNIDIERAIARGRDVHWRRLAVIVICNARR